MRKKGTIFFIGNILLIIAIGTLIVWNLTADLWEEYLVLQLIAITVEIVSFILSIKTLKLSYKDFISENRSWMATKKLTKEEAELVTEAKELIKKVDKSVEISEFTMYKVRAIKRGWFYYDEKKKKRCTFLPFKRFFKMGKEFCFMAVVHEILHSQNLKDNFDIFDVDFLEGLNQFLTNWLIENYSAKYKIPKTICIASLELKDRTIEYQGNYAIYEKEVQEVKNIIEKAGIDKKELFLKYINFEPEFFKEFVPVAYWK